TLARGATSRPLPPIACRKRPAAPAAARLQELERLDVDQVPLLADDVRLPHRFEELLRSVEVPQPDLDAAEPLPHVAVRAWTGDDQVVTRKANCLLVERGEGDSRIEYLEDVDLVDDLKQVLVVGYRMQAVERVGNVDEAALAADLGDRLAHRHPALDALGEKQANHLALVRRLHLLRDDHPDAPDR